MTPESLDRLEALAAAARDEGEEGWYDEQIFLSMIDGADDAVVAEEDAALIAALSPDVVRSLVADARLGAAWAEVLAAVPYKRWMVYITGDWESGWEAELTSSLVGGAGSDTVKTNGSGWYHDPGDLPTPAAALLSLAEALRGRK